jgi:hypothetical protein
MAQGKKILEMSKGRKHHQMHLPYREFGPNIKIFKPSKIVKEFPKTIVTLNSQMLTHPSGRPVVAGDLVPGNWYSIDEKGILK